MVQHARFKIGKGHHDHHTGDPVKGLVGEKRVLRFESFGDVDRVLKEAEMRVPVIFGEEGEKILPPLKATLKKYAVGQGWDQIALSLSQGMAQRELDELLEREIGHEGPLVIDPDARTEDHQVYASQTHAKLQKARLIRAAEVGNGILLVVYGINASNPAMLQKLLMHRVRMAQLALEQIDENDSGYRAGHKLSAMEALLRRRVQMTLRRLKTAHERLGAGEEFHEDAHGEMFLALAALLRIPTHTPEAHEVIANLVQQLGMMPGDFVKIGVSYEPYMHIAPEAAIALRPEKGPQADAALSLPRLRR